MYNDHPIKVSIVCLTYNHEKFIDRCIEGFLMQKTNFPFEILIHDDASTDGTVEKIKHYQSTYPGLIYPLFQKENQMQRGVWLINFIYNYPRARGKYIAFCEGDDYWTDPFKLQKQADFLDQNPDFVGCYHNSMLVDENGHILKEKRFTDKEFVIEQKDLILAKKAMSSPTNMFRKIPELTNLPEPLRNCIGGDSLLYHLLGFHGKVKYMTGIQPSAYRVHSGGVWSMKPESMRFEKGIHNLLCFKEHIQLRLGTSHPYAKEINGVIVEETCKYLNRCVINRNFKEYFKIWRQILQNKKLPKAYIAYKYFMSQKEMVKKLWKKM